MKYRSRRPRPIGKRKGRREARNKPGNLGAWRSPSIFIPPNPGHRQRGALVWLIKQYGGERNRKTLPTILAGSLLIKKVVKPSDVSYAPSKRQGKSRVRIPHLVTKPIPSSANLVGWYPPNPYFELVNGTSESQLWHGPTGTI